jgi:hypothetical protein
VVPAGDTVQLQARHGSWQAGPDNCGALWYVDEELGGSAERGLVDDCGLYQAPEVLPEGSPRVRVEAHAYALGQCADCCPFASIELQVAEPAQPAE